METYITQNINRATEKLRFMLKGLCEHRLTEIPDAPSSVAGSINEPGMATDCLIYGTVIIHGNARLHNCMVGYGVTLEVGDGCVLVGCRFDAARPGGSESGQGPVATHISIGRNSYFLYVYVLGGLVIGDSACVYAAEFYHNYVRNGDIASIGDNATILQSKLVLGQTGYPCDITVGNNFFTYNFHIKWDLCKSVKIGNNCVLSNYEKTLRMITHDVSFVWVRDEITHSPALNTLFTFRSNKSTDQYDAIAEFANGHKIQIGDNFYMSHPIMLSNGPGTDKVAVFGDNISICAVRGAGNSNNQSNHNIYFYFPTQKLEVHDGCSLLFAPSATHTYYRQARPPLISCELGADSLVFVADGNDARAVECQHLKLRPRSISFI